MRDVAAEVMRRCQCRCNSFRTIQCPSSATAVECLGGRGVLVYRSFLAHILEFYLVAVLDENLGNVGVVAVTAAADAGRAAVGRHDDPIALIGRACSRSAMLKPVWHCSRLIAALCDGL